MCHHHVGLLHDGFADNGDCYNLRVYPALKISEWRHFVYGGGTDLPRNPGKVLRRFSFLVLMSTPNITIISSFNIQVLKLHSRQLFTITITQTPRSTQ